MATAGLQGQNGASNSLNPPVHGVAESMTHSHDVIEMSNTELDVAIAASNDMEEPSHVGDEAPTSVDDLHVSTVGSPLKMSASKTTPVPTKAKDRTAAMKKTQSDMMLLRNRSALPTAAAESQFEWRGVNVYVGSGRNRKQILHDFNGSIKSGELLALMGGMDHISV